MKAKTARRITRLLIAVNAGAALTLSLMVGVNAARMEASIPSWWLEGWRPSTDAQCEVWSSAWRIGGENTPQWIARIYRDSRFSN